MRLYWGWAMVEVSSVWVVNGVCVVAVLRDNTGYLGLKIGRGRCLLAGKELVSLQAVFLRICNSQALLM